MNGAADTSLKHRDVGSRNNLSSLFVFNRMKYLLLAAPVVLTVLIYANTLNSPFTFDDEPNILNNPSIRLTRITGENLKKAAFQNPISNRPAAYLSFAFNYYVHRHDVRGYRLVNILIHIFTGFALWGVLYATLTLPRIRAAGGGEDIDPQRAFILAGLASMLWLAHPVNTHSVTYITQRMNILSAMFYLIAVYAYIRIRLATTFKRRLPLMLCAILCGALAFGSKETAITLPVACFLYEWIFFRQADATWLRKTILPFMAVLTVIVIVALLVIGEYHLKTVLLLQNYDRFEFNLLQRVMTEWRVVVYYISLLVFPHPSRLNLEHDYPLSFSPLSPPTTAIALTALLLLFILAFHAARRKPLLSFCVFWFLATHALESSFISLVVIYEYRNYLPFSLPVLLAPVLLAGINRSFMLQAVIIVLLTATFANWSFHRNRVWSDEISLWRDSVMKTPGKALPRVNLAVALAEGDRIDEALFHIQKALLLDPSSPLTHTNMGFILEQRGNREAARDHYRKALELDLAYVPAMNNLANSLADDGRYGEAVQLYRGALSVNPRVEQTHFNLALALIEMRKPLEAEHHLRQTILLNPEHPGASFIRMLTLIELDRVEDAMLLFQKMFQGRPPDPEMFREFGLALLGKGKYGPAREYLEEAVFQDPDDHSARLALTRIFLHQGRQEDAIRQFAALLRIRAGAPEFHMAFERAFARRIDRDRAIVLLVDMIRRVPENPCYFYILGSLHHRNRDYPAARSAYMSALALEPGFIPAIFDMARLHSELGEFDRALSIYTVILSQRPDIVSAYYNIACIHALRNEVEKAFEWLNLSIKKGFDQWEHMANDPDLRNIRDHMDFDRWIEEKRAMKQSE